MIKFFIVLPFLLSIALAQFENCPDFNPVGTQLNVDRLSMTTNGIREHELIWVDVADSYYSVWIEQFGVYVDVNSAAETSVVGTLLAEDGFRTQVETLHGAADGAIKRRPHGTYNSQDQIMLIVWQTDIARNASNPDFDIVGRFVDSNGVPFGAIFSIGAFTGDEGEPHVAYSREFNEYFVTFEALITDVPGLQEGYNVHVIRLNNVGLQLQQVVFSTTLEDRRPSVAWDAPASSYVLGFDTLQADGRSEIFIGKLNPQTVFNEGAFFMTGSLFNGEPVHDHEVQLISSEAEGEVFAVWEADFFGTGNQVGNQSVFASNLLRVVDEDTPQNISTIFIFSTFDRNLNPDVIWIADHNEFGFYFEGDDGTDTDAAILGGQIRASNFQILSSHVISTVGEARNPEIAYNTDDDQIGITWEQGPILPVPNLPPTGRTDAAPAPPEFKQVQNHQMIISRDHYQNNGQAVVQSSTVRIGKGIERTVIHPDFIKSYTIPDEAHLPLVKTFPTIQEQLRTPADISPQNKQSNTEGVVNSLRFNRICGIPDVGLTGGEVAGIVIGTLVGCFCICFCIAGIIYVSGLKKEKLSAMMPKKNSGHVELRDMNDIPESSATSKRESDSD